MRALLIAAAVLAGAGAAEAGEWRYTSHSQDQVMGFDQASLRVSGNRRTVWSVRVEKDATTVADVRFDYVVSRSTIDCDRMTKADTTSAYYRMEDDQPAYVSEDADGPRQLLPDSVGEEFAEAVCGEPIAESSMAVTAEDFARFTRERLFPLIEARDRP